MVETFPTTLAAKKLNRLNRVLQTCIVPGICTGLCEADSDCPSDMRCTLGDFAYLANTPGGFDDGTARQGFCTYAAGSRTACNADEDCATTGTGGAAEVCWPTNDAAGDPNHICVTPPEGYGREGDACGDDPTTDAWETRICAGGNCQNRRCGGVCEDADDCPSGWSCEESFIDATVTTRYCVDARACTDDAGCDTGEICVRERCVFGRGFP